MSQTLIKSLRNPEVFLALKRLCTYLAKDAWNTWADAEYEYAVQKSKEYESEVKKLAELDADLRWGDVKHKTKGDAYMTVHEGDFNPWYDGDLTLEQLLSSTEMLAELLGGTDNLSDAEFVHYYDFLNGQLPHDSFTPPSITIGNLHPKIVEHCEARFHDGHYSDAILAAYKVVLNEIKDITGISNLDGTKLVQQTFRLEKPLIKLNPLITQSDKDEQLGFMSLYSGAAQGIRNPKAHDLVMQDDKEKTLYYLAFASLLMQRLDERFEPK